MGNRDRRDDKVKKQKKSEKIAGSHVQAHEPLPQVEVVKKKRKDVTVSDED